MRALLWWGLLACVAGCAPTLNWREVRLPGFSASALLPCKPSHSARQVLLSGQGVQVSMSACKAGGWAWAIVAADVVQPARVPAALQALRDSTLANHAAHVVRETPMPVRGTTTGPEHHLVWLAGRRPDGAVAIGSFVVFAYGTQVFQAIVVGEGNVPEVAAETFFESLRVGS